jgi:hypothetical protein
LKRQLVNAEKMGGTLPFMEMVKFWKKSMGRNSNGLNVYG